MSENENLVEFNVLDFWKNNRSFPIMKKIAMRYLACCAGSATSERIFSLAGQIYTAKRNRLGKDLASKILYLRVNQISISDYTKPKKKPTGDVIVVDQ